MYKSKSKESNLYHMQDNFFPKFQSLCIYQANTLSDLLPYVYYTPVMIENF